MLGVTSLSARRAARQRRTPAQRRAAPRQATAQRVAPRRGPGVAGQQSPLVRSGTPGGRIFWRRAAVGSWLSPRLFGARPVLDHPRREHDVLGPRVCCRPGWSRRFGRWISRRCSGTPGWAGSSRSTRRWWSNAARAPGRPGARRPPRASGDPGGTCRKSWRADPGHHRRSVRPGPDPAGTRVPGTGGRIAAVHPARAGVPDVLRRAALGSYYPTC